MSTFTLTSVALSNDKAQQFQDNYAEAPYCAVQNADGSLALYVMKTDDDSQASTLDVFVIAENDTADASDSSTWAGTLSTSIVKCMGTFDTPNGRCVVLAGLSI